MLGLKLNHVSKSGHWSQRHGAIPRLWIYFVISVFHNIIGATTKRFVLSPQTRIIFYRSYKKFFASEFVNSVAFAPFHVIDIFDEIDDMAWYTNALLRNIIDEHAHMKARLVESDSVPYMN